MAHASDELRIMVELIKEARTQGIVELQYKDLKVRFSQQVQRGEPGSAQFNSAMPVRAAAPTWSTTLSIPEPKGGE